MKLHEAGFFGQKAIAGVNGVTAEALGNGEHFVGIAVAAGPENFHRLIGQPHMQRIPIGMDIECHGGDAQVPATADNPDGDFAAIGDQNFGKHRCSPVNLLEMADWRIG
jgi:hypothetical protein